MPPGTRPLPPTLWRTAARWLKALDIAFAHDPTDVLLHRIERLESRLGDSGSRCSTVGTAPRR